MFPSAKTRITTAARRGFDLALEFATLGEYRLAEPHEADGPTGVRPRSGRARSRSVSAFAEPVLVAGGVGAGAPAPARPRASRVGPATAAARRLQPPTAAPAPAPPPPPARAAHRWCGGVSGPRRPSLVSPRAPRCAASRWKHRMRRPYAG